MLFWARNKGELYMQWNLDKDGEKRAFEIFKKIFKSKFIKPRNINTSLLIKLPRL